MEITNAQIFPGSGGGSVSLVNVYGVDYLNSTNLPINPYSVMAIPAVFRGVNLLAGTLAGLPKYVALQEGNVYQPTKHPLNRLLSRRANPIQTPFVFWETFFHHALLWGNAYAPILRNPRSFDILGTANLNPESVTPFRVIADDGTKTQWYQVRDLNGTGKNGLIRAEDMLHVPGLGFDGMCGYPLIDLLADTFQWARNVQKFSQRYFNRGTQMQGSIEIPAGVTKEQIDQIKQQVRDNHSGMSSDYGHLVLSGGAKLNNTTIDPQKSQLMETANAGVIEIARILGVSPWYLFELGRATWGNATQQAEDFVKFSLRPWTEKAEEELSAKLLTAAEQDAGKVIRFDVEDLTRGDYTTVSETTLAEVNGGIRTPNEGRARLGIAKSTDPEADKLRKAAPGQAPASTKPAKSAKNAKEKPE